MRVAAEEEGDELFREKDDDDAGKEASVSEASRAVDETLAACDEDGFVQTAGGLWTCLVSADADLVRHVTAHDADAMRDLEKHHGATVILPSSNAGLMSGGIKPPAPGSIMLAVPSKRAAVDAKRDLESLTHRALRSPKLQYTHFVNIPLVLGVDGEARPRAYVALDARAIFRRFARARRSSGRRISRIDIFFMAFKYPRMRDLPSILFFRNNKYRVRTHPERALPSRPARPFRGGLDWIGRRGD